MSTSSPPAVTGKKETVAQSTERGTHVTAVVSEKKHNYSSSSTSSENKVKSEPSNELVVSAEKKPRKTPWNGIHDKLRSVVGGTTHIRSAAVGADPMGHCSGGVTPTKKQSNGVMITDSGKKLRVEAQDFTPKNSPQKSTEQSPVVSIGKKKKSKKQQRRSTHPSPTPEIIAASTNPPVSITIAPAHPTSNLSDKALRKVMVNYLSMKIKQEEFTGMFEPYGAVATCTLMCDNSTGQSKGYGFVEYWSAYSAMTAIHEMNGSEYRGKRLKVHYADHKQATVANTFIANNPQLVLLGVGMFAEHGGPSSYTGSVGYGGTAGGGGYPGGTARYGSSFMQDGVQRREALSYHYQSAYDTTEGVGSHYPHHGAYSDGDAWSSGGDGSRYPPHDGSRHHVGVGYDGHGTYYYGGAVQNSDVPPPPPPSNSDKPVRRPGGPKMSEAK